MINSTNVEKLIQKTQSYKAAFFGLTFLCGHRPQGVRPYRNQSINITIPASSKQGGGGIKISMQTTLAFVRIEKLFYRHNHFGY